LSISLYKRDKVYEYLDDVHADHTQDGKARFRRTNNIGSTIMTSLVRQWEVDKLVALDKDISVRKGWCELEKAADPHKEEDEIAPYLDEKGVFDIKKYLNYKQKEIADSLLASVKKGNAASLSIVYKLTGDLNEKPKEKERPHDIKDLARAARDAERELADERRLATEGVPEVQTESGVLLPNIREDTGQDATACGGLPELAPPDSVA